MKRNLLTFSGFILLGLMVFSFETKSQTAEELQQINTGAKVIYVKAESLDQLMIRLRPFENNLPAGQESLMMDTYRTIANGYAVNNHFKQAYEVYKRYLSFKENYYLKIKSDAIQSAQASIHTRKDADEKLVMDLQNQVSQLQIENDQLISKRSNFKKYFSAGLIALSALFASLLVGSGIKLNSIRVKLKQSRERMKEIHRIAALGAAPNVFSNTLSHLNQISTDAQEISSAVKELQPAGNAIAGLTKKIKDCIEQLRK